MSNKTWTFLSGGALVVATGVAFMLVRSESAAAAGPEITVYKSPACACCTKWITYLRDNGFAVTAVDMSNTDLAMMKADRGITRSLSACHTAIIEGYVVEGHVPADVVRRMLRDRPEIAGLAVPGMPPGSPGMEVTNPRPYNILALDKDGTTTVYATR
jgi:hypothetical protein